MKITPNKAYHMLGTDWRLDPNRVYDAVPAYNQPEYKEKGKVFVISKGHKKQLDKLKWDGFLLENGEYTVLEP